MNQSAPKKIIPADDFLKADEFYRQASEGAAFLYQGDFQNAKQLLQAVQRRIDKNNERKKKSDDTLSLKDRFNRHRQAQSHKAQLLARLLVPVSADLEVNLKRAPDVRAALLEALPANRQPGEFNISLRELLGYIGAHEWRKNGVHIEELGAKIHPHYGIFSPVRGEYLSLIASAPLPTPLEIAFDIGTGTGVIAALLAKRGVKRIIATDNDDRAIACAAENIERLGYRDQVLIEKGDMFPQQKADLIVCNPPWIPARPTASIEFALYDENSQMLRKFLSGVAQHLNTGGEAWLIISDLAEILELRDPSDISMWAMQGGLKIVEVLETRPRHAKARDENDPLYEARSREITKLYRLKQNITK
jgi:methylase of polypeptide subunit release factors